MPLQEEERLFIDAIRDLNYQASQLQEEENDTISNSDASEAGVEEAAATTAAVNGSSGPALTRSQRQKAQRGRADSKSSTAEGNLIYQRLDNAADALVAAASRTKHEDCASPNLQSALAWMSAISQKPDPANKATSSPDSVRTPSPREPGPDIAAPTRMRPAEEHAEQPAPFSLKKPRCVQPI